MTDTDRALLDRVRSGDREAFQPLVTRYAPRLYEVILRMTKQPAVAEDLLQDALVQAYRALPRFRGDSAFYTWLYRIAVNCALGHLRKKRNVTSLQDDEVEPVAGPNDNPERRTELSEMADAIDEAVEKLGDANRVVFVLREMEGLSFEEIARVLKCSEDVVRARLYRAKKQLKEWLAEWFAGSREGGDARG